MKIFAVMLVAIASFCAIGCESKPDAAKPAGAAPAAAAPAGSAAPADSAGW